MVIEALGRTHDRSSFECGNPELDHYIRRFASPARRCDTAATFVAVEKGNAVVAGYYTLSMSAVRLEVWPARMQLPDPDPDPVPVALLGHFAVSRSHRGQGLGKLLLVDALRRAEGAGREVAAHAIVVDAIDADATEFYSRFGSEPFLDDPRHLFLPMKGIRKLVTGP